MKNINKKGFTLIELLAVVVVMGILMAVAIPSINLIITDSRKVIYINSARTFINEAEKEVVNSTFEIDDPDTTYYIHIANLVDDVTNLGKSGFATWSDSYVVATMALVNNKVTTKYYFNSSDEAAWKVTLVERDKLKKNDVYQDSDKNVDFMAVGNRSKIVVYDKNGVRDDSKVPYISINNEKADKCYKYKDLTSKTVAITAYSVSCGNKVIIPSAIGGKEVREISNGAFANKELESVQIPFTVTTLGQWAFSNTGLTTIDLPNKLKTIGNGAFFSNKLTSLMVPDTVESIGPNAFKSNKLSKLELKRTLKSIGTDAFNTNELTGTIDDLVPNPATTIGSCAFCNNKLKGDLFVYAADSNGKRDYSTVAGYMGNLKEFSNKTFIIPSVKNGIALKSIGRCAFCDTSLYTGWSVVIPDTVTSIGQWAFSGAGLVSANMPSSLKTIDQGAFYNNKLTIVSIPEGTETIGQNAFSKNNISKLTLPRSLKSIGIEAFSYNQITGTIKDLVPGTVTTIGSCAFCNNKLTEDLFVYKKNADNSYDYSILTGYVGDLSEFSNKTLVIPSTYNGVALKRIDNVAFGDTSMYTGWSVVIPNTVTSIGSWAFSGAGIVSTNLPSGLKTIEQGAFYRNKLTIVNVPSTVETIGNKAFSNNNISKLTLPSSLKSIGTEAFSYNQLTGLLSDYIPSSNTTIGACAFCNNKLTGNLFMYKKNTDGSYDYSTITGYMGDLSEFSNKTFVIPSSKNGVKLKTIANCAFCDSSMYTGFDAVIPDSVTSIGEWAFSGAGLVSIKLPEGLTTISKGAFNGNKFTTITIPSTVTTIGNSVFTSNSELKKIINKTGKSFNWKSIVNGSSEATFETGTIKTSHGDIIVTKE